MSYQEISYTPQRNETFLCLSRDLTNSVPFISAISLVNITGNFTVADSPDGLYNGYYYVTQFRWNFGGNEIIRYPDDIFDHYWFPIKSNSSYVESTAQVEALTGTVVNATFPPEAVMNTALTTNGTMTINIPSTDASNSSMTLLYMAELNPNAGNASRQFYLGEPSYSLSPTWLANPFVDGGGVGGVSEIDYYGTVQNYLLLFTNQSISTALGPLVNALEIFELSQNQSAILTNEQDTLAIEEIKSSYGNLGVWTGDPCFPYPHPWVTCSNVNILQNSSSIIAVNLSGYGLTGPISPSFGKLRSLTSLVLENNELNGLLPDFSQFPNLTTLTLHDNHLTGSIPLSIWEISTLTTLDLSNNNISGNLIPMNTVNIPCPRSLTNL
jgi:Leucine-rich repeat (LRR) protein